MLAHIEEVFEPEQGATRCAPHRYESLRMWAVHLAETPAKKPSGQKSRLSRSSPAFFEGSKQGRALVTKAKARELLALRDGGLLSQFAPAGTVKPSGTLLQVLVVGRILLPPSRISHTAPVAQ